MKTKRKRLDGLGQRISHAREARGWTQEQLGDAIDKSPMTVSRYERDTMVPGADALHDLAVALDVSADQLLGLA